MGWWTNEKAGSNHWATRCGAGAALIGFWVVQPAAAQTPSPTTGQQPYPQQPVYPQQPYPQQPVYPQQPYPQQPVYPQHPYPGQAYPTPPGAPQAPYQQPYPGQATPPDPLQQVPATRAELDPASYPAATRAPRPPGIDPNLPPPPTGHCEDGKTSPYETDVDCGGYCGPCEIDQRCNSWHDCTSGLCAVGVCQERQYREGDPIPNGYEIRTSNEDRAATARLAGGIFLGSAYAASYLTALLMPSSLSWLYVPILGPWGAMGRADRFEQRLLLKAFLGTCGALQAGGAVLWLGGYVLRGSQLVRTTSAEGGAVSSLIVAPSFAQDSVQFNLSGLF